MNGGVHARGDISLLTKTAANQCDLRRKLAAAGPDHAVWRADALRRPPVALSGRVLADVGAIALLVDVALIRSLGLLACSCIAGFHVPLGEFAVRLGFFRAVAVLVTCTGTSEARNARMLLKRRHVKRRHGESPFNDPLEDNEMGLLKFRTGRYARSRFMDRRIGVFGAADEAGRKALFLRTYSRHVMLFESGADAGEEVPGHSRPDSFAAASVTDRP